MSEGTTKPNGSREKMNVKNGDDKAVAKKIEKFGIEVAGVVMQVSESKLRATIVEENGDSINKPNDFVLVSNPKSIKLDKLKIQDIMEGNTGKVRRTNKTAKKSSKTIEKDSKKGSKNTEQGR